MNKTIFFDMGNTLINYHMHMSDEFKIITGLNRVTEYLQNFNSSINYNTVESEFYQKWAETFLLRKINNIEYKIENYLYPFLQKQRIDISLIDCQHIIRLYYSEFIKYAECESKMPTILKRIKDNGYNIGVISNSNIYGNIHLETFRKLKLFEYIDGFVFSYDIITAKPDLQIFKKAIKKMNTDIEISYMVGDNLQLDIFPSEEIGLKTVWYNSKNMENNTKIKPDFIVKNFSELLHII